MTNLPTGDPASECAAALTALLSDGHAAAQENLTRAFVTFTQAAGSLEKSYTQLQSEVARLHVELHERNSELERSLEENARMRGYLTRVLENLAVRGTRGGRETARADHQSGGASPIGRFRQTGLRAGLVLMAAAARSLRRIARVPAGSFFCEQEIAIRRDDR